MIKLPNVPRHVRPIQPIGSGEYIYIYNMTYPPRVTIWFGSVVSLQLCMKNSLLLALLSVHMHQVGRENTFIQSAKQID
jgi:hypothetical protein